MTAPKPCGRPGCTAPAKGTYCSRRCCAIARLTMGWHPDRVLTATARQVGGQKGGLVAGQRRRGRVMRAWFAKVDAQIPTEVREALSPADLARVKALVARTMRRGWKMGYRAGHQSKSQRQRRTAA